MQKDHTDGSISTACEVGVFGLAVGDAALSANGSDSMIERVKRGCFKFRDSGEIHPLWIEPCWTNASPFPLHCTRHLHHTLFPQATWTTLSSLRTGAMSRPGALRLKECDSYRVVDVPISRWPVPEDHPRLHLLRLSLFHHREQVRQILGHLVNARDLFSHLTGTILSTKRERLHQDRRMPQGEPKG